MVVNIQVTDFHMQTLLKSLINKKIKKFSYIQYKNGI